MVRSGDYFLFESDSQEDEDDQKEDEKEEREGPDKSAFQVARLLMLYFISIHPHFIWVSFSSFCMSQLDRNWVGTVCLLSPSLPLSLRCYSRLSLVLWVMPAHLLLFLMSDSRRAVCVPRLDNGLQNGPASSSRPEKREEADAEDGVL